MSFSIQNASNPSNVKPIVGEYEVITMSLDYSLIDTGNTSSASGLGLNSASFSSLSISKPLGEIKVGDVEDYEFLITPRNPIPNQGKILISIPSELLITGSTCTAQTTTSHDCSINMAA